MGKFIGYLDCNLFLCLFVEALVNHTKCTFSNYLEELVPLADDLSLEFISEFTHI
jgi:hypothetical protein